MTTITRHAFLIVLAATAMACGASSPTAPAPIIPTVTGQFTGTYRVTSCSESGAAIGFCASVGSGGAHVFTPQQTGSNLSGSMSFGGFSLPVTGSVGADNVVALSGSGEVLPGAVLSLTTWRGTLAGTGISGNLQFTIATANPVGTGTIAGTFTIAK